MKNVIAMAPNFGNDGVILGDSQPGDGGGNGGVMPPITPVKLPPGATPVRKADGESPTAPKQAK